jgi:hypothetical protein
VYSERIQHVLIQEIIGILDMEPPCTKHVLAWYRGVCPQCVEFIAHANSSQKTYAASVLNHRRRTPEVKMLSYDQVKRRVSRLSGVVTWQHNMCVDSCVGFTGPFAHLEACPRCHKPRYDPDKLAKSGGKKKVPQKSFTTFPVGPQLQSRWKSPGMAEKMHYRRNKTTNSCSPVNVNVPSTTLAN